MERHEELRVLLLSLIVMGYVAICAMSVAIPDTTRDMYAAYEISRGRWLPLEGPVFGGAVHLSSIWYYLLAIPFFFVRSWLAVILFVAAIAALKFLLAYLCGSRLVDREFGLLWASCLAFPGWTTIEQFTLSSPNVTEAAILAVLLLNITLWDRHSLLIAFALGLACGLAVHTHPTTVVALPLSLASALLRSARAARVKTGLMFLLGLASLFIPYAVSQIQSGLPDLETSGTYITGNISFWQLFNVPAIWYATLIVGPLQIGSYLLHLSTAKLWTYEIVFVALGGAGLIGVLHSVFAGPHRRLLLGIMIAVCLLTAEITLLRANTPVYFVYVLVPFLSALTALGLWQVGHVLRLRYLSLGVAVAALSADLLLDSGQWLALQKGVGTLPAFFDIVRSPKIAPYTDIWFPAYAHDANGDFMCAYGDRISVHGAFAYIVDRNLNVDSTIRCDRVPSLELSGQMPRDRLHVTGLPLVFWEALQAMPSCWLGPIGISPAAQVLWPPTSIPQVSPRAYYPRPFSTGRPATETLSFDALPSEAVVITNVVFGYVPWEIESVESNGSKMEPTLKTEMSRLYVSPGTPVTEAVHWRITYVTPDPSKIDVVTVSVARNGSQSVSSCNSDTGWQTLEKRSRRSTNAQ